MTFTQMLLADDKVRELWQCQRMLNPRPDVYTWHKGRTRYRSDTRKRVTAKQMIADGWKMVHRFDPIPVGGSHV
jgi:hypothetical protein